MRMLRVRDAGAEAVARFESLTGARCFVLEGKESPQVLDLLDRFGVIGVVQDPTALELDQQHWRDARATFSGADIEAIFDEFCRTARLLYNLQANPVHGAGVAGMYIDLYRKHRGKSPAGVFDVGFGYDPAGGILAAAMYNVKYSGATTVPEANRSSVGGKLMGLLDILRLAPAVCNSQGRILWRTPFGSGRVPVDIGKYQLVFSHTVLEHVVDLPAFLADVRRVLSPDGCFISYVDLTGHETGGPGGHPLDFLCWPQQRWDELVVKTKASDNYLPCRRERLPWYVQTAREAGFRVQTEIKTRVDVPERIARLFPGDDLTPEGAILYCDLMPIGKSSKV